MEENNYTVYMHVNKINDKKYVGITKNVKRRWSFCGIEYKNQYFGNAIRKYGWENFDHLILFKNLSKIEACNKEIELIRKYNTTNSLYGYNISLGGDGVNRQFNNIYQYSMEGYFIKKYENILDVLEDLALTSSANIYACCAGNRVSSYGFRWFYEYQGDKIKPEKSPMERTIEGESIPLYQYSLQGDFIKKYKSRQEVLEKLNIDTQFCTRGITKTAGNFQWFQEYKGKKIDAVLSSSEKLGIRQSKKVYLYDLNYNLVRTFDKCKDVCEFFNTYHKKIKMVIENKLPYENYYISYNLL